MIAVKMGEKDFTLPDDGYDAFVEFLYHTPSQPELLGLKKREIKAAYESSRRVVRADNDWYMSYKALKSYHAKHGNCSVPFGKESGSLRSWTERQKKLHASSMLDPVKVDKMKALDFDFTVKKPLSARSVNTLPLKHNNTPTVAALATSTARGNKPAQLDMRQSSKKRKKEVPVSSPTAANEAPMLRKSSLVVEDEHTWKKHYEALKVFQAKHGHCSVPFGKDTGALRSWTERQKRLYASSQLETDKVDKMTELGYDFRS
mmetsp:Transcript_28558/g.60883  ORF Transcript_28558/g.60883 Transcript_28558/m.60883 type:complete len:260 (+) Transcript_28558:373-1152(+)|eukprot:CAMPEP_0172297504 /NCGR_PEP_ID=MMETSP1058-20130122/500_1 /TAXON_ID=83371 /ORGANISM="Detonula confervacea, Strain CCMP 353" /LENGTH=259 /DNA_ID=CAMNT_0013006663 /DNA_START=294 /DNA_END=1073 /DNA_ORIENTATION=-